MTKTYTVRWTHGLTKIVKQGKFRGETPKDAAKAAYDFWLGKGLTGLRQNRCATLHVSKQGVPEYLYAVDLFWT